MALTEYEKKVLEQMEASLREEDPALASQMSAPAAAEESEPSRGPRAPRRIALGFGGATLGMVVLVAAVSLGYSVVSILLGGRRFRADRRRRPVRAVSSGRDGLGRRRGGAQGEEGQGERRLGLFHSGSGTTLGRPEERRLT